MSKEFVEATIRDNKVVVFSKTYCPYCKMAKQQLNKYKGQYKVPRVFINGKCIGGGSETKAAEDSGKLKTMLSTAGAI